MKILVIGRNGQLGNLFFERNRNSDFEIIYTNRDQLDLENESTIVSCLEFYKPNIVINLAAYTKVDNAEEERHKAFTINSSSMKILSEATSSINATLIHISSDYVYNGTSTKPHKENSSTDPTSYYGFTKLIGEENIKASGCNHIIIRTSWVFSEYGENFLKTMLNIGKKSNVVKVVNDQRGCPTYGGDIVDIINKFIYAIYVNDYKNGIYNFCSTPECSWYDFAIKIFSVSTSLGQVIPNKIIPVSSIEFPSKAIRPSYSVLDCLKIQTLFSIDLPSWERRTEEVVAKLIS